MASAYGNVQATGARDSGTLNARECDGGEDVSKSDCFNTDPSLPSDHCDWEGGGAGVETALS